MELVIGLQAVVSAQMVIMDILVNMPALLDFMATTAFTCASVQMEVHASLQLGSAFVLLVSKVYSVKKGVLLGNLGTNASISVNVKGQLLVIQLLESACVHLVGLETGAMWNAEQLNMALIVLSLASVPTNPIAVHTMEDALVSTNGWGQLVKKVALQDFLLMKNKLRKEGMLCQDHHNRNTWTNK